MVTTTRIPVRSRRATATEIPAISATLARAFSADPVFAWTFPDADRRAANLPALMEPFVRAYVRHRHTYVTEGVTGAALWLPPDTPLMDGAEEAAFAAELEELAGPDVGRLFELLELFDAHHPDGRFWTLQLLAVEPELQGRGIGSGLLAPVLAKADSDQVPVYLEATSRLNRALYERHGFETIGEIQLPDGPAVYPMWREPR
jgi:GNAT superfamily N-acetyltransferase